MTPAEAALARKLRDAQNAIAVLAQALSCGDELHLDGCPEDDTCDCPLPAVINAALANGAVVRAANGGGK